MDKNTQRLFKIIFQTCLDIKAESVLSLDLSAIESYTDGILIASASNERQMQAIADGVIRAVYSECGRYPLGTEGYQGGQWILIDFGEVVCHVFLDAVRQIYRLEDMWPQVKPMDEKEAQDFLSGQQTKSRKRKKSG